MPDDPNSFCMFKPTVSLTRLLSVFLVLGFVLFVSPANVRAADAEPTVNLFTELNTYAQFSKAAYAGEAEMRQISANQGYTLSLFESIQGLELSYSLLTNDVSKNPNHCRTRHLKC